MSPEIRGASEHLGASPHSAATERERELAIRRDMFVRALAEFVGGTNQARMSIALGLPGGELKAIAELWSAIRTTIPGVYGYRSVEEAEISIREFLKWPVVTEAAAMRRCEATGEGRP